MNNRNRRDNGIDRWETVKVLMSETATTKDGTDIGVSLVINRPIFKDGNEGFPKASVVLSRNGMTYRIPFFKGSAEEPEALLNLFGSVIELWHESARDEYEGFVKEHKAMLDARRKREIDDHDSMMHDLANEGGRDRSGVGGGLSKYTKGSKTARKKKRKRGQQHEAR